MNEKSENEEKIRKITKLYYSNPKVQEIMLKFSKNREVVPRYFEGFGKRPDMIQYISDIMGLVNRGATSFHCSEEIWKDPFSLNSDFGPQEMNELRESWDLLIDIDSKYLDLSKIAAKLLIRALEFYGIRNYGIKFSGSKGFHIIVSGKAFPEEYDGKEMRKSFPEWPRAITEFLFNAIEKDFRIEAGKIMKLEGKKSVRKVFCLNCERPAILGNLTIYECPVCSLKTQRKDVKSVNRRLRCLNSGCGGVLEVVEEKNYYFCEYCKDFENEKNNLGSDKYPEIFREKEGEDVSEHASFDLVLVAPRHLFRMPYSLHEKTSLASIVIKKEQIENFNPRDADPLKVNFIEYYPENERGEARRLLAEAMEWKKGKENKKEEFDKKKYAEYNKEIEIDFKQIDEKDFPEAIKNLLKGLKDGRKRGLFVLITFLRSLNFPIEYIVSKVSEWNKKNEIPLKEGYIRSQLDWQFRQKKKILPPNYSNQAFYQDIGILDGKPEVKNPIVEVLRKVRRK